MSGSFALSGPLLAIVAAVVYTSGMAIAWRIAKLDYTTQAAKLIRAITPLLVVLVALMLGLIWWSGLDVMGEPAFNWWVVIGLVPPLVMVAGVGDAVVHRKDTVDWRLIAGVALGTMLVGIGEEAAFRGLAFNGLAEQFSVPLAVVLSSVLFGFLHSVNVLAGLSVREAARQVVFTSVLGMLIAWVYVLSGRNLVLVMAWHFLWDFATISTPEISGKPNRFALIGALAALAALVVLSVVGFMTY